MLRFRRGSIHALGVLVALLAAGEARAQGCVAARMNTPPVTGAHAMAGQAKTWSAAFSWRYYESDRHFVGNREQTFREVEGSEAINRVHQLDLAITRSFTERFSLTVDVPYFMNERSTPIRDPSLPDNEFGNPPVAARTVSQARGMGDITVVPRWWAFDPTKQHHTNLALGLGLKLPTGDASAEDTVQVRVDSPGVGEPFALENEVQTVDQSIQPGDGGFGFVFDLQGFHNFDAPIAVYLTASYLANPENTNGIATGRGPDSALLPGTPGSEAYMSVADQYLARVGGTWFSSGGLGVGLGLRWEGVPVHDAFGSSDGFRRPGYSFSVEPGLSYTRGTHTVALLVPVALHRNRQKSEPDLEVPPRHGDAAFADYQLIASYVKRFGKHAEGE